jgi:serine phosphatase RsbU (regulator of sigma subunit)/anti-sigma regulatory factor (Ser/Thr protein kinase)
VAVLDRMRTLGRLGRSSALARRRPEIPAPRPASDEPAPAPQVDIAPDDPLLDHLRRTAAPVDLDALDELGSPAVAALREAGIVLVVPLVTAGELVGVLNLGPRRSEQGYSTDDRRLLDTLAGHAAPALRVGQLVREHEAEAREVERISHELRVAQLIQQQFLPQELPARPGWDVEALYRPARTVGGDFYDFVDLDDGRLMVVCGDVTDKGVPAALVMSSTHALLRENGPRLVSPGAVLARVNDLLCASIPEHMFVTCLVMVIDPADGRIVFANAGHNLPYLRGPGGGVRELRATGMPLGLLPGQTYDEVDDVVVPGESMLLHSDGLAEAHAPDRTMFGFEKVKELVGSCPGGRALIERSLAELAAFTGPGAEQEDDITLVTIQRDPDDRLLTLHVPSEPGGERDVVDRVGEAALDAGMAWDRVQRLRTAVGETVGNAIEHGNRYDPALTVEVVVHAVDGGVQVRVSDRGGAFELPAPDAEPDLDAKLAEEQTPRGWGLFLVRHMVDAVDTLPPPDDDPDRHTVVLTQALQDSDTRPGRTR